MIVHLGAVPKRLNGTDCKSVKIGGSNPPGISTPHTPVTEYVPSSKDRATVFYTAGYWFNSNGTY